MANAPTRKRVANLPAGVSLTKRKHTRGEEFFCAYLGKKFTGGKAIRKFFKKEQDARDWLNGEEAKKEAKPRAGVVQLFKAASEVGLRGFEPKPDELTEALIALRRCKEAGISIAEVVDVGVKSLCPAGHPVTLREACDAVYKQRELEGLSDGHLKTMKGIFDRICQDLGKEKLHKIDRKKLQAWATKQKTSKGELFTESTRQSYYRYLGMVFREGEMNDWCAKNPLKSLRKNYKIKPQVVTVLKADEMARLLGAALRHRKDLVASLAIKAFAGLRSSEVMRLEWGSVQADALQVPAPVSKTGIARVIDHIDPLRAWLKDRRLESGKVVDLNPKSWHNAIDSLASLAGVTVARNSIRHSFGTYRYFVLKSPYQVSEEMGNSPKMVKSRYVNLGVPKEDCTDWWKITPTTAKKAFAKHLKGSRNAKPKSVPATS
jgi:integrase